MLMEVCSGKAVTIVPTQYLVVAWVHLKVFGSTHYLWRSSGDVENNLKSKTFGSPARRGPSSRLTKANILPSNEKRGTSLQLYLSKTLHTSPMSDYKDS